MEGSVDFRLNDDQKFFKERISQTLRRLALPEAESIDKDDKFPSRLFEELGRLGYYGIRYPAEIPSRFSRKSSRKYR
jgi:alkylation response protein AidB-like acyl-CoA dehydrogenase